MNNLKEYFDQLILDQKKAEYNIFSVLHAVQDETRLHSRFIAFLLNPNASHNLGNSFFKLFLQEVLRTDFDTNNYEIKTEYEFIDLLIHNDKDAIILENKIYAGDSNHNEDIDDEIENTSSIKEGYKGQLERYYNTITTGHNKKCKNIELHRNVLQVAYLTLNGHSPSDESKGKIPINPTLISYVEHINRWLTLCAEETKNINPILTQDIQQYQNLIVKLTSDINQARKNQKMISNQIDDAWLLEKNENFFTQKKLASIFNHVKWHTIADFFNELTLKLSQLQECIIESNPTPEEITKVAHSKGKSNKKLFLKFILNGYILQIVCDNQGLTRGNRATSTCELFSNEINKIKFNDFHEEATFKMISHQNREKTINAIISELNKSII